MGNAAHPRGGPRAWECVRCDSAVFVAVVCVAVGTSSEDQPGGYVLAAIAATLNAMIALRCVRAELVLNDESVRLPTWRPFSWSDSIPIEDVRRFVLLPSRGGTVGIEAVDGRVRRTSIAMNGFLATHGH